MVEASASSPMPTRLLLDVQQASNFSAKQLISSWPILKGFFALMEVANSEYFSSSLGNARIQG